MAENKRVEIKKKYLVTGGAGFIGFHLAKRLVESGAEVVVLDNLNDYYDVNLKRSRLKILSEFPGLVFIKGDLASKEEVNALFRQYHPQFVVNLGAQAGVRYSIDNPDAYINSNIIGFYNILEACRKYGVEHLVYASSSSVYGANAKIPFSVKDNTDRPVSLYAATKKSNELMAFTYSHLFGIPSTGLRFFTVYGPFGRPDMAYFLFTKSIIAGTAIKVYNHGDMYRDFTFIDDIITGIINVIPSIPGCDDQGVPYKLYNIGNNKPEKLTDFIQTLEVCLGKKAIIEYYPMQPGDVFQTYADVSDLMSDFDFKPNTSIRSGLETFVNWYLEYYGIK